MVLIENVKNEIVVRREVRFVYGFQAELDRLYGWGLQWGRGFKTKAGPLRRGRPGSGSVRVPAPLVPVRLQGGGGRQRGALATDDNAADVRARPRDAGVIRTKGPSCIDHERC